MRIIGIVFIEALRLSEYMGETAQNSAHWLHMQIHPISVAATVF